MAVTATPAAPIVSARRFYNAVSDVLRQASDDDTMIVISYYCLSLGF